MKLLSTNYKLEKPVPGWRITGLSLAPHNIAGLKSVCPASTAECRELCLGTNAGLNVLPTALQAKVNKTKWLFEDISGFARQLGDEIMRAEKSAKKAGERLAVRLNVYSDIAWEDVAPDLFNMFPDVQFYDYTKVPGRRPPHNYHLTYSYTGLAARELHMSRYANVGINPAVVFDVKRGAELPSTWRGMPVIDGDLNDFRPADPVGVVVGLRYKGPPKLLQIKKSKFVQEVL